MKRELVFAGGTELGLEAMLTANINSHSLPKVIRLLPKDYVCLTSNYMVRSKKEEVKMSDGLQFVSVTALFSDDANYSTNYMLNAVKVVKARCV